MLQTSDGETEILLGNKQLLGIFFVVVILLGVAFAGGYKVGQGSKKAGYPASNADQTATAASSAAETHSVAPEGAPAASSAPDNTAGDSTSALASSTAAQNQPAAKSTALAKAPASSAAPSGEVTTPPLGSTKSAKALKPEPEDTEAPGPSAAASGHNAFTPQPGQIFLQVAAVGRDEAEGISDVLSKKGFRAHAVPKPGSTKLYRVIIGPTRDASDLSNTRAALRNTGFREIIVQKY
ncbi:MAG TPA: SPOR domain-containing protein [Bryobacteraceae bacterium]|jgi:cell division septation protein DedD|nr:SPOR domain-containing protein [Bryobacteraceae bacterium]